MQHLPFEKSELMSPADVGSEAGMPASAVPAEEKRDLSDRRMLRGMVVSDRMEKTITVRVERLFKHAKYKKYVRKHKKYHAHDEEGVARIGDEVEIIECRPLSKIKRWRLLTVLRKAEIIDGGVS